MQDNSNYTYKSVIESYPAGYLDNSVENLMLIDQLLYLPDNILYKVDTAGMSISLETRIPLLSREVVEYAWCLPIAYKYKNGVQKRILKDILYQYVPKSLVDMSKRGLSISINKWLRKIPFIEWSEELISKVQPDNTPFLDCKAVKKLWNDYKVMGEWGDQIWYLLVFMEWLVLNKE